MFCVRASWKLGLTQLHGSSAGLLCRLGCNTMVSSVQQIATRAFVSVLVVLARSYDVALAVSRDSSAEDLLKAYRRLLQKVSSCVRGFLCCRLPQTPLTIPRLSRFLRVPSLVEGPRRFADHPSCKPQDSQKPLAEYCRARCSEGAPWEGREEKGPSETAVREGAVGEGRYGLQTKPANAKRFATSFLTSV